MPKNLKDILSLNNKIKLEKIAEIGKTEKKNLIQKRISYMIEAFW